MTVKETIDAVNEMGSKGFDSLNSLGELNLKVWERLAARQMETINLMMETGVRQMKVAGEAKSYSDFLKGQVELAKDSGESIMAETKTNMGLANEVRDEYRAWFQSGVSELTAEMRKSASAA
jgi:phasin family protein